MPFQGEGSSEHNMQELRRLCALGLFYPKQMSQEELRAFFGFKEGQLITREDVVKVCSHLMQKVVFPATEILALEKERLDLIIGIILPQMKARLIKLLRKPFPLAGKLNLAEIKGICALNPHELSLEQAKQLFCFGPGDPINWVSLNDAYTGFLHDLMEPAFKDLTGQELVDVTYLAKVVRDKLDESRYSPQEEVQAFPKPASEEFSSRSEISSDQNRKNSTVPETKTVLASKVPEKRKQKERDRASQPEKIILYKTTMTRAGTYAQRGFDSGTIAIVFPNQKSRDKFAQTTEINSVKDEITYQFKDEDKRGIFLPYNKEDGKDVISFKTNQQAKQVHQLLFGNSPLYKCDQNKISFDLGLHNLHLCASSLKSSEKLEQKNETDCQLWTTSLLSNFSDKSPVNENAILYSKLEAIAMEARYHIFCLVKQAEKLAIAKRGKGVSEAQVEESFKEIKGNLLSRNSNIHMDKIRGAIPDKDPTRAILEQITVYNEIMESIPQLVDREGFHCRGNQFVYKNIKAEAVFVQLGKLLEKHKRKMMSQGAEQWNKIKNIYQMRMKIAPEMNKIVFETELGLLESKFALTAEKPQPGCFGDKYTGAEKADLSLLKNEFLATLKALVMLHPEPSDKILIYKQYRNSPVVITHRESSFFRSWGRTTTAINIDDEIKALQKELESKRASAKTPVSPISKPPYSQPRVSLAARPK